MTSRRKAAIIVGSIIGGGALLVMSAVLVFYAVLILVGHTATHTGAPGSSGTRTASEVVTGPIISGPTTISAPRQIIA